ncbi:hypothetical protein ABH14_10185 [Brevibacillus brevis]|uniref:helix-turn-helix domain-containing protein n=1 Tax=Brevibacillus brevis TaxID=1393 RepID=UPI0023B91FAC|nr:helix-turn-helix transcriptional regulator [Brevibacillus brevis]MBH0330156.1 hypothetical protein [Brevibacillus brevis]
MALQKGRCRLPEILRSRMMKPAEFSRRMSVTESIVSRWISEEREMSFENAVLAARILDCHAEDFYEWIDVKKGNRQ